MRRIIVIVMSLIVIWPLWWMVTGSFQPIKFLMSVPPKLLPVDISLKNYIDVIDLRYISRYIFNTLIVVAGTISMAVIVNMSAGYAFAIYRFKGRKAIFWFLISLIVLPQEILIIPQYVVMAKLHLVGTHAAVILHNALIVTGVFFAKNFIQKIPREMIESGRLDGAGEIRIMRQLVLPLCGPVIGVIALISGVAAFGNFLWQLLVLQRQSVRTLVVGLILRTRIPNISLNPIGMELAAGTLLFIPVLLVYIFTRKYFTQGLSSVGMRET